MNDAVPMVRKSYKNECFHSHDTPTLFEYWSQMIPLCHRFGMLTPHIWAINGLLIPSILWKESNSKNFLIVINTPLSKRYIKLKLSSFLNENGQNASPFCTLKMQAYTDNVNNTCWIIVESVVTTIFSSKNDLNSWSTLPGWSQISGTPESVEVHNGWYRKTNKVWWIWKITRKWHLGIHVKKLRLSRQIQPPMALTDKTHYIFYQNQSHDTHISTRLHSFQGISPPYREGDASIHGWCCCKIPDCIAAEAEEWYFQHMDMVGGSGQWM